MFFRAEDLAHARAMIARLLELDGRGVRPGLFRVQALSDALRVHAEAAVWWRGPLDGLAEHGLLLLLVGGTALHFTPRAWVDERLCGWFCRLPGPAIGALYAGLCLLIIHLLDGPRANIYFAF